LGNDILREKETFGVRPSKYYWHFSDIPSTRTCLLLRQDMKRVVCKNPRLLEVLDLRLILLTLRRNLPRPLA
jgi:hypothetical protein